MKESKTKCDMCGKETEKYFDIQFISHGLSMLAYKQKFEYALCGSICPECMSKLAEYIGQIENVDNGSR